MMIINTYWIIYDSKIFSTVKCQYLLYSLVCFNFLWTVWLQLLRVNVYVRKVNTLAVSWSQINSALKGSQTASISLWPQQYNISFVHLHLSVSSCSSTTTSVCIDTTAQSILHHSDKSMFHSYNSSYKLLVIVCESCDRR